MGGINTAGVAKGIRRRAIWKNESQLAKLREEGKCFRCERRGSSSRRCPLLPEIRPNRIKANLVSLPEIDPSVYNLDPVGVKDNEIEKDSEN